ncbi:hypothetical protein GCM10025298_29710 [Natronobiforma cellulositropha]
MLAALALRGPSLPWRFHAAVVCVVLGGVLVVHRATVTSTRLAGPQRLTLATVLTLSRALALAFFAGLTVVGPAGRGTWVAAGLFAFAVVLDAADGALARAIGATTALGARVDAEVDGATVLLGSVYAVAVGGAPAIFLAVGLARYAFVLACWWRTVRDNPVSDLPPSRRRRVLGSAAMAVCVLAVLPVVAPRISWLLAAAVTPPFLVGFAADYLSVSRRR